MYATTVPHFCPYLCPLHFYIVHIIRLLEHLAAPQFLLSSTKYCGTIPLEMLNTGCVVNIFKIFYKKMDFCRK